MTPTPCQFPPSLGGLGDVAGTPGQWPTGSITDIFN